ncbi:Nif3-like dinuclear metal center hexameric protein [Soonwooa sp.]|uniref:Nif3-like dinuclear metal center hexameric protein n=1 Tax=Soonwooa sp. TaxID=1938592 RepID=UPI0026332086|nr:Nif3-like dinuclear metal center hexameric protein [Soonwooa sp.]
MSQKSLKEVCNQLDRIFSIRQAEDFDNVGLLCGHPEREVTGILVTHDALEDVVDEAIEKGFNLIVAFHPIIFSGLKSLTGKNYVEKAVLKAIENKIAIYAMHTAFDNDYFGVNFQICEALGLKNQKILMPKSKNLKKLEVYVPKDYTEKVKEAIFEAGAGSIGFYDECSFGVEGSGSFRAKAGSNPFLGKINEREIVEETLLSFVFENFKQNNILKSMFAAHPYEEVAYNVINLENDNQYAGLGRYGDLENELPIETFLEFVKKTFNLEMIRYSNTNKKTIKRVGVLGGSGASGIKSAMAVGCDAYLTGDVKYHDFFAGENKMLIGDIGHFESEQFVTQQLYEILCKNFTNFAIAKTTKKNNPVNYFF